MKPTLELQTDWLCIDGYYCLPNSNLFLHGFVMDHKSYGSEINIFSIPLFTSELKFHLSYVDNLRLQGGVLDIDGKTPTQIAEEFLEIVVPLKEKAVKKDSLEYFMNFVEVYKLNKNTRIAYEYALALVLAKRFGEAFNYFNTVGACEWENRVVPEEANNAKHLASLIESNPTSAVNEVESYLERNRQSISEFAGLAT